MAIRNFNSIRRERGNWKVIVSPRPESWEIEVYLLHIDGDKRSIANILEDGYLKLSELKGDGMDHDNKPFMRVPEDVWQLLVDAVTESTPPTKKEVVEGILDATKEHLEDMRKLVFEDKNTITLDPNYLCGHGSCLPGKCNYKDEIKK